MYNYHNFTHTQKLNAQGFSWLNTCRERKKVIKVETSEEQSRIISSLWLNHMFRACTFTKDQMMQLYP